MLCQPPLLLEPMKRRDMATVAQKGVSKAKRPFVRAALAENKTEAQFQRAARSSTAPSATGDRAEENRKLGRFVYGAIKSAIRDGTLKAGHRLREREVADWLGVSRTPVREAFKMLRVQGVVSAGPWDGMVITTLSRDAIEELYNIWADLESIAARYAANNACTEDIKRLRDLCNQWDKNLSPGELGILNHQFHEAFHAAARNRYLTRALEAIDDSLALLGMNTYTIPGRPEEAGREHLAIVRAVAKRDPDAAFRAAQKHIRRAAQLRASLFYNDQS